MRAEVIEALDGLCRNLYTNIVGFAVKGELDKRVEVVDYDNFVWAIDFSKHLAWIIQTLKVPHVELYMFNFDFIKNDEELKDRDYLKLQFGEGVSEDVKNEILDEIYK